MPDIRCSLCGEPGQRLRPGVYAHLYPRGQATGPSSHGFLADVTLTRADELRSDPAYRDARWFERTHRAELRYSEDIGAASAGRAIAAIKDVDRELDFGPLETPEEPEHGLTKEDLAS